jgi:hypothetical protein
MSSRTSCTRSRVASDDGAPSGTTLMSAALPSGDICGALTDCAPSAAAMSWARAVTRGSSEPDGWSTLTSSAPLAPGPNASVRRS